MDSSVLVFSKTHVGNCYVCVLRVKALIDRSRGHFISITPQIYELYVIGIAAIVLKVLIYK